MALKPETPATGVLVKNTWGDALRYQVVCDCGQSDHEHDVWVEANEFDVEVQIYVTTRSNFWSRTRWHHIWQLITQGHVRCETVVSMNRQQALNYATILKQAVADVEQFRKTQ
jgi:hypothetical protein